jgi:glycosyltransferase involved in cell wall biosynthesis
VSDGRNDSLRVLAYADSDLFSGAESVHCELVRGLEASAALEIECAAPRSNGPLARCLKQAIGRQPIDVPSQRPTAAAFDLYAPRRRSAVGRALARESWDVLLVNLPSAEYGPTPVLAKRQEGTRAVGLLHVPGSLSELGFRLGGLRERLARRAMSRFDSLCVVAESGRRTCERVWAGAEVPVHVVPLPRPRVERFPRGEARARLGLPAGTVVGMAGRISFKQKGQETFVEAAARMLDADPDLHFAVAGEGRDAPRLREAIARLGLGGRVSLLGQVAPIGAFLSAIDAIAIPSRFEGLPLIALEALTVGVPGVAAEIDGLRDVWPAPWLVAPGDPGALAAALRRVIEMPAEERARLIEEGRRQMNANTCDAPASVLESVIMETAHG